MVEYFCGEKAVTNAFGICFGKKKVKGYDIKHDPHHQNLNTGDGFLLALVWLLRLIEAEGLTWWGTVCSSFIWLARGHSRRTKQAAQGNAKVPSVAYTPQFGQAVANAFLDCRDDPVLRGHLHVHGEDELDLNPTPSFAEAWEDLDLPEIMDALKSWSPASAH